MPRAAAYQGHCIIGLHGIRIGRCHESAQPEIKTFEIRMSRMYMFDTCDKTK